MLVLTRRQHEAIVIGDVTVTVVEIRGDIVRLGIEAPPQVGVHRREVWEAMRRVAESAPPLLPDGGAFLP